MNRYQVNNETRTIVCSLIQQTSDSISVAHLGRLMRLRGAIVNGTEELPVLVSVIIFCVFTNALRVVEQKCTVLCENIINGTELVQRTMQCLLEEVLVKLRAE